MVATSSGQKIPTEQGESFYLQHHAPGDELPDYACRWVPAHFEDPLDYVRRDLISEPDDPPAHGFRSSSGDRRAWTLELQCAQDVSLTTLRQVVVTNRALLEALPPEFVALAEVAGRSELHTYVAELIEARLQDSP